MCKETKNILIQKSHEDVHQDLSSIRKRNRGKRISFLFLMAILFGIVSAVSNYGTSILMKQSFENTNSLHMLNASTNKSSSTNSLNVTDIASSSLSSVVSVTNVSVQEVKNYFGNWMGRSQGFPNSQIQQSVSCGSGIILYEDDSQIYMVTNYHVVEGATNLSVTFIDDETYEAFLCGYDENIDLAVIKVDSSTLSDSTKSQLNVMEIGDSNALQVGEQVVAIGNALGYGQSVTTGIVSAVNRTMHNETKDSSESLFRNSELNDTSSTSIGYIQTDAAINPGNSGGALIDMDGKLIGINTAKISSTDVEGIGYAIPISQVLDLIKSLMQ